MVLGCSFDGLKDRYYAAGEQHLHGETYRLAHVILPANPIGQLLTGQQAAESRISSGLSWPPEAQVGPERSGHRVPVSWAWRLLVDAGDKSVRWSVGRNGSFPLPSILAAHINGCLKEAGDAWDSVVIAIPNELDEFGQDGLLRALRALKMRGFQQEKVRLIWRPVAAALAWLEHTQDALPGDIPPEDFILVVHLGPDCIEFVPLRLRERLFQGKRYVVPLREPPTSEIRVTLSGCDWAAGLIESTFGSDDPGAFWQALTGFPEIWEALAQRSWNREELPRVWSRGDFWDLWDPAESLIESMWQLTARTSACLAELTPRSCRLPRPVSPDDSWLHLIQTHVRQAAELYGGRLRGMILSGPLASSFSNPWLAEILPFLEKKGLRTPPSSEAMPDGIWVPGVADDAVAEGAAIYGRRLSAGEPTYLDTLSQLWTYAQDRGKLDWVALLKAEEVEGGKLFKRHLERRFTLPSNTKNLQVFLRRGDRRIKKASFQFPYSLSESMPLNTEIEMSPASGLAQVELVPIQRDFLHGQKVFLDYSTMADATEADLPKPKLGSPLLTKILSDPEDRKIVSDEFKELCEKFKTTHIKHRIRRGIWDLDPYCTVVTALRDSIKQPIPLRSTSNERTHGSIVDQDGKASTHGGQELIQHIGAKLGSDLRELLNQPLVGTSESRNRTIRYILQTATRLFAGAPPEVFDYLRTRLGEDGAQSERGIIEAAGRSFTATNDIKILYSAIRRRIDHPLGGIAFPIHSSRAICRILELREFGPDALTSADAETFVQQVLMTMERCVAETNFKHTFFQAVKLFLYLLRYREINQTFLLYTNAQDNGLLDRVIRCLEMAKSYVIDNPGRFQQALRMTAGKIAEKAAYLLDEIRKYIFFEGSPDIIVVLNEFAGQDN